MYDDLPGYRRLADRLPLPLAGGESLFGVGGFRDFVAARVFDVVQPDLALCGGFSEGLKIAAMAEAFDIPVVPHVWGTLVNFHASLHFAAILPEKRGQGMPLPLFEYDYSLQSVAGRYAGKTSWTATAALRFPTDPAWVSSLIPRRLKPFVINHWTLQ